MTWKVGIRHRSGYVYDGEVWASYNEARVTPLSTDRQVVIEAQVEVSPPAGTYRYWDYWGTLVDAFEVHGAHDELSVTGTSIVETSEEPTLPLTSWAAAHARPPSERLEELLAPTSYVPVIPAAVDAMRPLTATPNPAEAVAGAMDWVRGKLAYTPGATDVGTTASDALELGVGVCQDYAHLALSAVRALGIPARYVSGYIHPFPDAAVGGVAEGQSHAWIEAWVGGWWGLDPTHGGGIGERHVVVARGRDYSDVLPLKGVYHGGPPAALTVGVEFTRLA